MNILCYIAHKSNLFAFLAFSLYPNCQYFCVFAQFIISLLIRMQPTRLFKRPYAKDSLNFNPFIQSLGSKVYSARLYQLNCEMNHCFGMTLYQIINTASFRMQFILHAGSFCLFESFFRKMPRVRIELTTFRL